MTTDEKISKIQEIIRLKVTGVWEPRHTTDGHFYYNTKSGHLQASVTSKLGGVLSKPHLMNWAVRKGAEWLLAGGVERMRHLIREDMRDSIITGMQQAHTDIRDDAGDVGTNAHSALERFTNQWIHDGEMPEDVTKFAVENVDPRSIAAMRAGQKLFVEKNVIPIASEILVGDKRYSAGQLDFLCLWEGELCLADWKSSNQVSQDYILQVVAYKKFFELMTGLSIKKVKIILLNKDMDKYTIYKVGDFAKAFRAFKAVCAIYDWKHDKKSILEKDIKRLSI